ncbi:hypothetical protein [Actinomadura kijaniata]|uniref:hypothetical protein n=1 Tax=Actinomadura kijaniata TaxID=46161 RepID=UPI000835CF6A|nr:hypothetical protein [Actinomadura kijaniata]
MSEEIVKGRELLEAGDVGGLIRHLRFTAEGLPVVEVARLVEGAAALSGFDDLREASGAVVREPASPQALYDFGYACIERGVPELGVPALREALELTGGAPPVLRELAAALERAERHREAVEVLQAHDAALEPWPDRYLLAFNALLAGGLEIADRELAALPAPPDDGFAWAHGRLRRMVGRARAAHGAGLMDERDLRGWHFALTGGLLGEISPYGYDEGMVGRYAYTQVSPGSCVRGLLRLRAVLEATGVRPRSVSLLPERSSHILGLVAARVLGLPAAPFRPDAAETVVVAFDLNDADDDSLRALHDRAPGQVLYEHATCWTDPPAVSADMSGLLHQVAVTPWGERMRMVREGEPETVPADDRPAEMIAQEIAQAGPETGDEVAPGGTDADLARFAAAVAGHWLAGPRDRCPYTGPVRSSRFM